MKATQLTLTPHAKMFKNVKKKKKKATSTDSVSVTVLDPTCFDGLELPLMYKLQYKEAAAEGNGVYFCSK